jgi:arylsulfatase A-like enzyme
VAKTSKPNILFIMADDIGWFNPPRARAASFSIDWVVEKLMPKAG